MQKNGKGARERESRREREGERGSCDKEKGCVDPKSGEV
jgi:hypothetical protein